MTEKELKDEILLCEVNINGLQALVCNLCVGESCDSCGYDGEDHFSKFRDKRIEKLEAQLEQKNEFIKDQRDALNNYEEEFEKRFKKLDDLKKAMSMVDGIIFRHDNELKSLRVALSLFINAYNRHRHNDHTPQLPFYNEFIQGKEPPTENPLKIPDITEKEVQTEFDKMNAGTPSEPINEKREAQIKGMDHAIALDLGLEKEKATEPPFKIEGYDCYSPKEKAEWDRELLGKIVRNIWITYCKSIGDEKPSHLKEWFELGNDEKEADRRIGEGLKRIIENRTKAEVAAELREKVKKSKATSHSDAEIYMWIDEVFGKKELEGAGKE